MKTHRSQKIDVLFEHLNRQDELISQFAKPYKDEYSWDETNHLLKRNSRPDDPYTEFGRGIFVLKEYLYHYRQNLTKKDMAVIHHRVKKQTKAIESRYAFLERSLRLVIR